MCFCVSLLLFLNVFLFRFFSLFTTGIWARERKGAVLKELSGKGGWGVGIICLDVLQRGAEMVDAPSGDRKMEATREAQRTRKIKVTYRTVVKKSGMKSSNQSSFSFFFFLSCFCFPRVHFMSYSPKSFFLLLLLFKSPSHTSHFLIFYFFLPFLLLLFCFSVCNNISLREKKKENIIIYSAVEIMKTDVMNLL